MSEKFNNASIIRVILSIIFIININSACENTSSDPGGDKFFGEAIDYGAVWNGTHNLIAYAHGNLGITDPDSMGIYIINPGGTDKRFLYHSLYISGIDWSSDGNWIIAGANYYLVKISFSDGSADTILPRDQNFFPVWSPGDQHIAYMKHMGDDRGIHIVNSDGTNNHLIVRYGEAVDWPYQDTLIFTNFHPAHNSGSIYMANSRGIYGEEIIPFNDNFVKGSFKPRMHELTGRIVLHAQEPGNALSMWFYDPGSQNLYKTSEFAEYPNFSPDGSMVIFTNTSQGNGRLWIMNWDGTGLRQLTF